MTRDPHLAEDSKPQRTPTAHERRAGVPWDASYHGGPAPWDIGRPQPGVVRLAAAGAFSGRVLDAGCGTGDNAIHLASLGLKVFAFDVAQSGIEIARARAAARGVEVEFAVADALTLETLGRRFDSVLDSALFHALEGAERERYAAGLAWVTEPGANLFVLCFGDSGANPGPHPVSQDDLRTAFRPELGWRIIAIDAERVHSIFHGEDGAPAWLARVERV